MNRLLLAATLALGLPAAAPALAADYTTVRVETVVDAPIDKTWAQVGPWCAIEKWRPTVGPCVLTSGDGNLGSVRHLGGTRNIVEVMVAQTRYSYTYTQPGTPILYHGTLAAEPAGAGKTKLIYQLVWDLEPDGDQAARDKDKANRTQQWTGALASMKAMVEGAK
jgi:hypothetical protein